MLKKNEDADTNTTASAPERQATGNLTLVNSRSIRMSRVMPFTIKVSANLPWITSFMAATNHHNRSAEPCERILTPDEIKTKIAIPYVRSFSAMINIHIAQLLEEQRLAEKTDVEEMVTALTS